MLKDNSNITIKISNDKDVKLNIITESKSHIIYTSDIKTKTATELIKESVNEIDTLRIIKKYIDNKWISKLEFISSLYESMKKDYFVISELLINSSLDIILYKDKENNTFLHLASKKNLEICKLLIKKRAHINAKNNKGETPLHWAISNGSLELSELLISSGADLNAKDYEGWTPLHRAARHNHLELAQLLISSGADLNEKSNAGYTPLRVAAWNNRLEVAELLISSGAYLNAKNNQDVSLLEFAIQKNKVELVELLISAGANINFKNKDGYTPLHLCTIKDNLELFISLLERGADPELKSDCGNNCLHLAVLNNSKNILYRILKYHNMDINTKNSNGCSPIKLTKNEFIYNLLIENGAYDEIKELLKRANYKSKMNDILASVMAICFIITTIIKQHEYTEASGFFGIVGLISLILLVVFNYPIEHQSTKILIPKKY